MEPVTLRTPRLVLSPPTLDDADRVFEYCQDPLFETYFTTPWPYHRSDAEHFLGGIVPNGWRLGREFIWALREREHGPLLGVVGLHRRRAAEPESLDVGYWIGAPHRGHGYMSEAVRAVTEWALGPAADNGDATPPVTTVYWECAVGNLASARTARAAGFRFTGLGPSQIAMRDGSHPPHWHGSRTADPHEPTAAEPAWPAEVIGARPDGGLR